MSSDTLNKLRALGLPMTSRYPSGEAVAWTTDAAKADAARELGVRVTEYRSRDPRFTGREVAFVEADDG
jgi:hypothetical protein